VDVNSGDYGNAFDAFRRELSPRQLKRLARFAIFVIVVAFVATFGVSSISPWTEYLWFSQDVRQPQVFSLTYSVRGELFSVSFLIAWACIYFNVRKAFHLTLVFIGSPASQGQRLITNAIGYLQIKGGSIIRIVAPILAFISAADFSNEYASYLLASHAQHFGVVDPAYGLDLSFFVFLLPWYQAVANFACALLVLTAIATVGVYAGIQGLAMIAKVELGRPAVRKHIHMLIAVAIIAYAVQMFLRTYGSGLIPNTQFTGAGLADSIGVVVQRALAFGGLLIAGATLVNGWKGKPFQAPATGGMLFVIVYVVGVQLVPAAVQRFYVSSNLLERQAPYADRAIRMTRFAYGLDKIQVSAQDPTDEPTSEEVAASKVTLDNMRLWDPTVLKNCLEVFQGIRPYYRFYDVDVDRYQVDGKETMLMLAARQMDLQGLLPNAQNWTSERLLYTHGYGVVVSKVDAATPEGEPVLLDQDIPEKANRELAVSQPRIYFGNERSELDTPVDEYAIVNTKQSEFDYPTSDSDVQTRWSGDRGIPIGSLWTRLAYSVVLGDVNLLVSTSIGSESKLLMHRNVVERAKRLYPFLTFDADPYIFLNGGKVYWLLDGYTMTDMAPYSAMTEDEGTRFNYIRNSVKVVVDAYTGETTAYSVDDSEPILKAWRAVYPGLIHPQAEIPSAVSAHFRYPEDLLRTQSQELCNYHVENPTVFLGNGDIWSIAAQRGLRGDREPIQPFYVEMKLPDRADSEFVQILPFSPNGRPTMTGWLAAHCDPKVYGQLTLYRLNQSNPIPGPEQIEGAFSTTPEIANINKQFQNQNSSIVVGNLLVIPLGKSFMYAESLFLKSNTEGLQSVPRLTKVILAVKGRTPVVKDTYREALAALFGNQESAPPPAEATSATSPIQASSKAIPSVEVTKVLDLLDKADSALRHGDFAGYGDLEKQARAQLKAITKP
jgi:uncharacterized membrane protein (UPF0182 family)